MKGKAFRICCAVMMMFFAAGAFAGGSKDAGSSDKKVQQAALYVRKQRFTCARALLLALRAMASARILWLGLHGAGGNLHWHKQRA